MKKVVIALLLVASFAIMSSEPTPECRPNVWINVAGLFLFLGITMPYIIRPRKSDKPTKNIR